MRQPTTPRVSCRASQGSSSAFTIVELLVVIAIISLLMALMVPSLEKARRRARAVACASNLRQQFIAMGSYWADYNETCFWRGADPNLEGMDWYVWGGRETGNLYWGQGGLFNSIMPRPLNAYTGKSEKLYRCPEDYAEWVWAYDVTYDSQYNACGNSYVFNSLGSPQPPHLMTGGFAGVKMSSTRNPYRTVFFLDTNIVKYPQVWHEGKGNIVLADGHQIFDFLPSSEDDAPYTWIP